MMPPVISALFACMAALFRSRASLHLEHLALRHQLMVYQRSVPRPHRRATDRLFGAWRSRLWSGWQGALAFVQPRTVIAWQRPRVRDHWRRLSQRGTRGRPTIAKEVRDLIRSIWQTNPTWGAPRLVGELRMLGIDVATSTVEKYRVRPPRPSFPTWKTFVKNHAQDLVALDCLVVPTLTHKGLVVLVILAHERRRVVHVDVTEHPTAAWTAPQVVEPCPWPEAPRYLLRARDHSYGAAFRQRVQAHGERRGGPRPAESVAASVRRTADWAHPPCMPGPRDRPACATVEAAPERILPLLA
jgi:putative transposase